MGKEEESINFANFRGIELGALQFRDIWIFFAGPHDK